MVKSAASVLAKIDADNAPPVDFAALMTEITDLKSSDALTLAPVLAKVARLKDDLDVDAALGALKRATKAGLPALRARVREIRAAAEAASRKAAKPRAHDLEADDYAVLFGPGGFTVQRHYGRRFFCSVPIKEEDEPQPLFTLATVIGAGLYPDRGNERDLELKIENEMGEPEIVRIPSELTVRSTDLVAAMRRRSMLFAPYGGREAFAEMVGLAQPPPKTIRDVVGWQSAADGSRYFLFPSGTVWGVDPDLVLVSDRVRIAAPPTGGTWEGFRSGMAAISRSRSITLRIAVLAGLAGMLLGLAGRGTLVICLSGPSGRGKSLRQKIAVAMTGTPRKGGQMVSLNSTDIALDIPLERGSCTVTGFDELQFSRASSIVRLVFVAAGELGRARANREGGVGLQRSWSGGVMTLSVEYGLAQKLRAEGETQPGGFNTRVLESSIAGESEVVDDDDYARVSPVLDNYGWAGIPFLDEVRARGWVDNPKLLDARIDQIVADMPDLVDLGTDRIDPARRRAAQGVAFLQVAGEVALAAGLIDAEFDVPAVAAHIWDGALERFTSGLNR